MSSQPPPGTASTVRAPCLDDDAPPSLCSRALVWLCPWQSANFPGFRRAILGHIPRAVTWDGIQHWRKGRRVLPADVAEALAAAIEARCAVGRGLVGELRDHAAARRAQPRLLRGCCAVREDGRDRRGNWRRR